MRLRATRLTCIASPRVVQQALPTLDLNFAVTKALDPRITFTRASTATYVGSDGLIKLAVTNLALRSEDFANSAWSKGNVTVTTNSTAAPDGTLTADLILETTSADNHFLNYATAITFTTATQSFYVKPNGRTNVALRTIIGANDWVAVVFNLTGNGSVTQTSAGSSSGFSAIIGSIANAGDGWYRISATATQPSRAVFTGILDLCTTSTPTLRAIDGVELYSGDTTKGVYPWGGQLEHSATVGEYIPTTSTVNSAPRFTHDPATGESLGLLIEEARTNSIRNSTMVGSVAGTPGTLPTNWSASFGGLTSSVVSVGTLGELKYIDIRLQGISTGTQASINFGNNTEAICSNGQTWTQSLYLAIPSGSKTNIIQIGGGNNMWSSGGTVYQGDINGVVIPLASVAQNLVRFVGTSTISNASATSLRPYFWLQFPVGVAIDITLRIGQPQLELGAVATSVIPTTTAAVTRAADVATITGASFTSWYNASAGTIYTKARGPAVVGGSQPNIVAFDDTPSTNFILTRATGTGTVATFFVGVNSTVVAQITSSSFPLGSTFNQASAYALNSFATTVNGGPVATDTLGAVPVVTRALLGSRANFYLNGTIARFTYYPTRLSNAELQALTAS